MTTKQVPLTTYKVEPLARVAILAPLLARWRHQGESLRAMANYLNQLGFLSPQGQRFNYMTVSRMLDQMDASFTGVPVEREPLEIRYSPEPLMLAA